MNKLVMVAFLTVGIAGGAFGQTMEPRSVDAVVADIEKQQSVASLDKIVPDKVPPALLEELGDAVMGVLINNPAMHDRMDRMIGGDGSPQLTAFHTDLGLQYLANGGLEGVRFGGPWGPGRFGMMYGWGRSGDWSRGKAVTLEGTLAFVGTDPAIQTASGLTLLGFPDFYYYAYTDGLQKDDPVRLEGYLFESTGGRTNPYLAVGKATIRNKVYDFTGPGVPRGYRGGEYGTGMMGGYGGMGPGRMMGGW